MESKKDKTENIFTSLPEQDAVKVSVSFARAVQEQIEKEKILSIITFGPALRGDSSLFYTWLILKDASMDVLQKIKHLFGSSNAKYNGLIPLVTTYEEVAGISDSFPLVFLDVLSSYRVIYGEDIFEGLQLDMKQIRPQVEQHLRTTVMQMRTRWIEKEFTSSQDAVEILFYAYEQCLNSARIALLLLMKTYIIDSKTLLDQLGVHFRNVDPEPFRRLTGIFEVSGKLDSKELTSLYSGALCFVSSLLQEVDWLEKAFTPEKSNLKEDFENGNKHEESNQ